MEYELLLILDPELSQEKREEVLKKIEDMLNEGAGKITEKKEWGIRKLAYRIKKKEEGFYQLYYFECPPSFTLELRSKLKLMPEVFRTMIVKTKK